MNKYDRQHQRNISAYEKEIDKLYRQIITQFSLLGASLSLSGDDLFSFDDYPQLKKRVEALFESLSSGMSSVIVNGIRSEWTLANNKNSEISQQVFGDNVGSLTQAQYRRYFSNNDDALEAFLKRKVNGLSLSDKVWKYTDQFKDEIELGLDVGIRNGMSADQMARELRQYLQYPDKLFRRVRDEYGNLQLSKSAKAFHPGQGVYRSSYKNARRLAATETNIAYMTADYERWQQLDFVVGIEIRLSNNHTLNGKPFTDICDELKGRYPKDFKFTGWHPHCRCHAISILKTEEELAEDTRRMLAGEEIDGESVNRVKDVPENFKKWVRENESRYNDAAKRGTLPYFIRDNQKTVEGILQGTIQAVKQATTQGSITSSKEKKLSLFFGTFQEFADKLFETGRSIGQAKQIGYVNAVVRSDMEKKGISLATESIVVLESFVLKYKNHPKASKGATVPISSYGEIEKAIKTPAHIYEGVKSKELVYVYTHPYEEGKVIKVVVHPNYKYKGMTINVAKSWGIVDIDKMEDTNLYRKIK